MKIRGIAIVLALALLVPGFSSGAADRSKLIEKAEMSMLVTGGIDMRPDGSIERYSLDHPEKLSPAVTQMIGTEVLQWRFEPVLVDGKPVAAHTNMSLRIVAKPVDEQNFNVRIQSARFAGGSKDKDERVSVAKKTSIAPMVHAMVSTGIGAADLYLALRIGADGKVQDAIVSQVNLYSLGGEVQMAKVRKILADSALEVVRKWSFDVPIKGRLATQPYWSGTLPVSFRMGDGAGPSAEKYGQWTAYIPGPCTLIPWRVLESNDGYDRCVNDAAPDGAFTLDGSGPKLLTPLMQG